jgi:hypothetical protein
MYLALVRIILILHEKEISAMLRMRFNRRGTTRSRGCVCCGCLPIPLLIGGGLAAFIIRRFFRSH